MKKICVTGAYGFIGKSMCKALIDSNKNVLGLVRTLNPSFNITNAEYKSVGNINSKIDYKNLLIDSDCVIHCAGKVPEMSKKDELNTYLEINTKSTKYLAEQAVQAGVRKLIFLSSVSVFGNDTDRVEYDSIEKNYNNKKFTYKDIPDPKNSYAKSKFEAEKLLWEISARTGLEVVVVRIPLVYGWGVKGNLMRLMKLINYNIPIPLGSVKNKRSLIGIDNLVNVLIRCIDNPNAAGKTFLVSDGEDLSTPQLLNYIASAKGHTIRHFPFPVRLLKFASVIFKKKDEMNKLIGSFQIDNEYTCKTLNWKPPVSAKEGIRRMVQDR